MKLKSLRVPKGTPDWAQESASEENQASRNKRSLKHRGTIWKYCSRSLNWRRIILSFRRSCLYWIQPRTLKTRTERWMWFLLWVLWAMINHRYSKLWMKRRNRRANLRNQQRLHEIWELILNCNWILLPRSRRCRLLHCHNHRCKWWRYSKPTVAETPTTRWIKVCRFPSRNKIWTMRTTWIWTTALILGTHGPRVLSQRKEWRGRRSRSSKNAVREMAQWVSQNSMFLAWPCSKQSWPCKGKNHIIEDKGIQTQPSMELDQTETTNSTSLKCSHQPTSASTTWLKTTTSRSSSTKPMEVLQPHFRTMHRQKVRHFKHRIMRPPSITLTGRRFNSNRISLIRSRRRCQGRRMSLWWRRSATMLCLIRFKIQHRMRASYIRQLEGRKDRLCSWSSRIIGRAMKCSWKHLRRYISNLHTRNSLKHQ